MVGDLQEWVKIIGVVLGGAVGFGVLKSDVKNLREDLKEHKELNKRQADQDHDRFIRAESEVSETSKTLEGVKVGVENLTKSFASVETKIDQVLARQMESK